MERHYRKKSGSLVIAGSCFFGVVICILLAIIFNSCNSCQAQEVTYDVEWNLNKDGVTYEYILFVAMTHDSSEIPFGDSLFTWPDSQWARFYINSFSHDSLVLFDQDRAHLESFIVLDKDSSFQWLSGALFARTEAGYYSNRATSFLKIDSFIRPDNVAGFGFKKRLRWK